MSDQPAVPAPNEDDRRRVEAIAIAARRRDPAAVARIIREAENEGRQRTLILQLAHAYADEVHHDPTLAIIELQQRAQRIDTLMNGETQ